MNNAQVMLVGSANIDLVVRTSRFPNPGETLTGSEFRTFPGGKGANQAVAAAKLGAQTSLIAKLGSDSFGDQVEASLKSNGVDTQRLLRDGTHSTGVALITVNEGGQNTIVVAPGTNGLLLPMEIELALNQAEFAVLLVQLEIPLETVLAAANYADGKIFILNPAPARKLPPSLLSKVTYLTPNETEAELLTGILPVDDASCNLAAAKLLDLGVENVLFTLGEKGSFLSNRTGGTHFPPIDVKPIDTTAAGDAFNGALARFLAAGEPIEQAIRLANIAGALSTTKLGAQDSMPILAEVLQRAN